MNHTAGMRGANNWPAAGGGAGRREEGAVDRGGRAERLGPPDPPLLAGLAGLPDRLPFEATLCHIAYG